jgi:hypothetical protein
LGAYGTAITTQLDRIPLSRSGELEPTQLRDRPGQQRLERAFAAVDAVQALQWGLQMIQAELRAIENISGGKFFFLDEEDLGFTPLNMP